MKLAICVPSSDYVVVDFVMSLLALQASLNQHPITEEFESNIFFQRSSLLIGGRTDLVKSALKWEADWILWIDSDMSFPPDAVHRLLSRNKNIIGANYVKRMMPTTPVAMQKDLTFVRTDLSSTGIEEVDSTGFGLLLVNADIYRKLKQPWFNTVWLDSPEPDNPDLILMGEDVFFFRKARHYLDEKLFIDHDLSQYVVHIGTFEYHNRLARATLEELKINVGQPNHSNSG